MIRIDSNNSLWRHVDGTYWSNKQNLWFHWNENITRNSRFFEKIYNDTRFGIKSSIGSKIYANLHDISELSFSFPYRTRADWDWVLSTNNPMFWWENDKSYYSFVSFYWQFLNEFASLACLTVGMVIHFASGSRKIISLYTWNFKIIRQFSDYWWIKFYKPKN